MQTNAKMKPKTKTNLARIILLTPFVPPYLDDGCSDDNQHGQRCQFKGPDHGHMLEDEEPSPAQLVCSVGRVAHVVHPFHLQLLDKAAPQMAQLVKAELAVIGADSTVACRGRQSSQFVQDPADRYCGACSFLTHCARHKI